ncbi:gamma-glutamylcysteine synthetase [Agrilactobacillus yilanensis]|uniref:Glutamate--cysteine ligase n=1 Tax=Agrilactobacillus yilanensis TaxID=2485997 RepID=A0ABW4J932_9LACO|nr:gamma-glutamylcysteine synthetase [Agrilactobacillus yilanensis]
MIPNLQQAVKKLKLTDHLLNGAMGVEVEEHRLQNTGHLSTHPYPETFGSRNFHPTLQSDFGESQMELITIPKHNETQVLNYLDTLQTIVHQQLHQDETIWPISMPPFLSTQDKKFISQNFGRPYFQSYRNYLEKVYGIEQELITGIHINFSIPEEIFKTLYQDLNTGQDYIAFKNQLYFRVAQNMALNRWLITYLFGASPISENTYWRLPEDLTTPVRSIRSSSYGYSNTPDIHIDYQSLHGQISKIDQYVANQTFFSSHEFYGPIRVKSAEKLAVLEKEGIRYLEMRMFDLNPFAKDLVGLKRLQFIRLLAIYSFCQEPPKDMKAAYEEANQLNEAIALGRPDQKPAWLYDKATALLTALSEFAANLNFPKVYLDVLAEIEPQIKTPELTIGAKVAAEIKDGSLIEFGRKQGQKHKLAYLPASDQPLPLTDNLSENQQFLVHQALIHGFDVNWDKLNVYVKHDQKRQVFTNTELHSLAQADQWLKSKFGTIDLK